MTSPSPELPNFEAEWRFRSGSTTYYMTVSSICWRSASEACDQTVGANDDARILSSACQLLASSTRSGGI